MEGIHGVDVSWLHHPHKNPKGNNDSHKPLPAPSSSTPTPTPARDIKTPSAQQQHNGHATPPPPRSPLHHVGSEGGRASYFPGAVTPPAPLEPVRDTTAAHPSTPTTPSSGSRTSRRPGLLSRASSEKLNGEGKTMPRRTSWLNKISSNFSSSPGPPSAATSGAAPTTPPATVSNGAVAPTPANTTPANGEEAEPYVPSRPRESSGFFSHLTRKLSAGQSGLVPKVQGKGGVCQRRVLNVDPNRERCLVPDVDASRLRKVSFCVDVEIAGGPKYRDEDDDEEQKQKKKDVKLKERAEGEALKHPQALKEDVDEKAAAEVNGKSKPLPIIQKPGKGANSTADTPPGGSISPPVGSIDEKDGMSRKKEKKKRSEEERKERKEKRRRRAEENGSIPVELSMDADAASPPEKPPTPVAVPTAPTDAMKRDRPTTDPVRIYRRCCQLRETPILKRITEQLMSPTCCMPLEPGVVHCLDLTGSRLQLADMVTLGDWLAVVPVKKLLLEDADLSDEGLRCVLAGLLAATTPQPTKRKSPTPKHRQSVHVRQHQERSGVIEKLTLKNNPRITRTGWKHISLFLYMCRSIKAIDLSMIRLPASPNVSDTASRASPPLSNTSGNSNDAAEILYKCLSQRLGGEKLEELIVSECGLQSSQIRKIVDGAIMCGINRLGFAGNHLDDEGLEHILHWLRSGVCGGLDLGGNDLRNKLGLIADALNMRTGTPLWALSFAGCNLDTASIKVLFPVLVQLPNFRFIDLSHNPDLCGQDNTTISLLRRYIGQLKYMKRIHLADVGMSSKQAIALADVLPEGPQLAHINILENPRLSALASAKDEESQEEACALYASYMAAVRVSNTLICIDIDVPSADNSEVVKALAKQVVAYSLRNMERFALAEATGALVTADATTSLTQPHGGEKQVKEIAVPEVLMHLVGHAEGSSDNHDDDDPAPDGDYIVGGTGVVKALQYVLGEKADDLRRSSIPSTPSGTRPSRPGSSAGLGEEEQRGKAKKMSKNLLDSARKIRARLQPALAKEAANGDDMAYRRLSFLDQTLQSMIQRFEEEYPETRLAPPPKTSSMTSSTDAPTLPPIKTGDINGKLTDDEDELDEDELGSFRPAVSRHNSDVSLAARALGMEEGHLHRLGQRIRREVVDSPLASVDADEVVAPWSKEEEAARLRALQGKLEAISGPELKSLVEHDGWDSALRKVGANMNDLRILQEQDPRAWEEFKESQMKARMNLAQDART
ncbi:Putative leucine-rich repeat domain superfamily [Septoria linicola]|uniref:Leucine-rich repeat domain superfamily n=1 Tax=Septoria linicola TaxID=215465 RepID=A0A9Q9EDX6_9PEZI|nr:Putative leucine-rich repeat domain superfamily [Septoria linicola]